MSNKYEYRKQHYVPQCYLKGWNDSKEEIWICNKSNLSLVKHSVTKNQLYEKNYYTITIDDDYIITDKELAILFEPLKGCKVFCHNKELNSFYELRVNYDYFDDWEIYMNEQKISNEAVKIKIRAIRILTIEKFWGEIEDRWLILKSEIESKIHSCENSEMQEFSRKDIITFVSTFEWRNKSKYEEIRTKYEVLLPKFETLSEKENKKQFDKFVRCYMLGQYLKYIDTNDSNIKTEEEKFNDLALVFFVIDGDKSFITSDNPSFKILDTSLNGQYFPISPKILLGMFKNSLGKPSKYIIKKVTDATVKEFNREIANNSFEYIISNNETIRDALPPTKI